jgi:hypothetical protein
MENTLRPWRLLSAEEVMMKALVLFLLAVGSAQAMPILNMNTPGAENLTVYPDHMNPNLYYLVPTVFVVSRNERGVPNFSYMEYDSGPYDRAVLQTTLRPYFAQGELDGVKARILQMNPQAAFTALPFVDTKVRFDGVLKDLIVHSACHHRAGTVSDEQSCSFVLNRQGIKALRPMLRTGIAITTQFEYGISGVEQQPDGSYQAKRNTFQVAGRIGGPELAKHPELFRDEDGDIIRERRHTWDEEEK